MKLQKLAFKKPKGLAALNVPPLSTRTDLFRDAIDSPKRSYTTDKKLVEPLREKLVKEHVKDLSIKQKAKREAKALEKDFFLSVLNSSATKRDARAYLQRFTPSQKSPPATKVSPIPLPAVPGISHGNGVNLGNFYGPAAVIHTPKFIQQPERLAQRTIEPQLHVALVKLRDPQGLDDDTLRGIGITLSQLSQLGLHSIVVIDCDEVEQSSQGNEDVGAWRTSAIEQASRMVAAIEANQGAGARVLDSVVGVSTSHLRSQPVGCTPKKAYIKYRKLLVNPLRRGIIPVIPSLGFVDGAERAVPVKSTDVVIALTTELASFPHAPSSEKAPVALVNSFDASPDKISLDRLIILEPEGGIPTANRPNGYHVFLNLEQEFETVQQELLEKGKPRGSEVQEETPPEKKWTSDFGLDNPFSKMIETQYDTIHVTNATNEAPQYLSVARHLENLQLSRSVLSILPRSSSAIITTPAEAANSGNGPNAPINTTGVGTRRQKNTLIHNLLTDKPVFSSSLPVSRLAPSVCPQSMEIKATNPKFTTSPTTFIKHGMSVTIHPDPKKQAWEPWEQGKQQINLDSQVDLPRLAHLIEDSFGRKLDVDDYFKRVNGRIAGVIIAGEYEGGAVLTWETPPGVVEDGSPESRARMVPYLDKFAVLKRAQGSSHADIVFKAMVRDCFPNGVVWRSRSDNVVNKWYFERSVGTWKLPGTNWTMFWTTPNMDRQTFLDFEAVCRGVVPSWADNKAVVD